MGQSKDQRRSEGMTGFKEGNKCLLLFASIILTLWTTQSEGLNLDHLQPSFENIEYNETPQVSLQDLERANDLVSRDYLIEFLQQLRNRGPEIRPMETSKRGIDFGLDEDFLEVRQPNIFWVWLQQDIPEVQAKGLSNEAIR